MRVVFISNFLNHHQLPLLKSFRLYFSDVKFIATERMPKERIDLGYDDYKGNTFVVDVNQSEANYKLAIKICNEYEVVILGDASEEFIKVRLDLGKITFRYTERILKKSDLLIFHPNLIKSMYINHTRFNSKPLYLLCAGYKVKRDFHIFNAYRNKAFKWGYFPEFIQYTPMELLRTNQHKIKIIWIGRFIIWKHPEKMILIANYLETLNIPYEITMIGNGPLLETIKTKIKSKIYSSKINIIGSIKHDKVREHLLNSDIFVFTSDRNEGWGAVLNEAMNSGCAIIANNNIGSVGYLIQHMTNGITYQSDKELLQSIKLLSVNPSLRNQLGYHAYLTIANTWNPNIAAKNLSQIAISSRPLFKLKKPSVSSLLEFD